MSLRLLLIALCVAIPRLAFSQTHDMNQPPPDQRQYPSLRMSGFGDVNYAARQNPEGTPGFSLGQLAIHMASELSPRVTFFGELSFSARFDAGTGSPAAAGFNTEVERMIVRFDRNDQLKVSFGRFHTPINYWNTQFHHGQWLQTTITRPELIQFGGRLLPVHFLGALVEGSVPAAGMHLNYKAGVGNGRALVTSRAGDAGDVNDGRAWLVNLYSRPEKIYGLEFGGSFYQDTVTVRTTPSEAVTVIRDFDERIVSAYAAWQKEDPEIIAEVSSIRHDEPGSTGVMWSHAYYIQAAYRLPQFNRLWKPDHRFEHVGVHSADAVFQGVANIDGSVVGARYDASEFAAFKGEFRYWHRGADTERNIGAFFQVCFTF